MSNRRHRNRRPDLVEVGEAYEKALEDRAALRPEKRDFDPALMADLAGARARITRLEAMLAKRWTRWQVAVAVLITALASSGATFSARLFME